MQSEREVIEYKVGIFVIVGLILLGSSIFLLGGESSMLVSYYNLKAKFEQVEGLQEGSVVSLAGVKVGNITKINFRNEENGLDVELRVNEDYKNLIRTTSTIQTRTQGALGDKYVYIEPGPTTGEILPEGAMIATAPSNDLFSALSGKGDDIQKIFDILNEVHVLMKRINGNERSEKIMANFADSATSLKDLTVTAKKVALDIERNMPKNKELQSAIIRLSSILKKLDEGEGTLGALLNDPSIHERIKAIFGGSSRNRQLKTLIRKTIQKSEEARLQ